MKQILLAAVMFCILGVVFAEFAENNWEDKRFML